MFRPLCFLIFSTFFLISKVLSLDKDKAYANIPKLGEIYGHHKISARGRQYVAFEGIPYAQPPIGDLRFQVITILILIQIKYIFFSITLKKFRQFSLLYL